MCYLRACVGDFVWRSCLHPFALLRMDMCKLAQDHLDQYKKNTSLGAAFHGIYVIMYIL